MTIPFHGGALLPTEQRETSPKFRRFCRFTRYQLSVEEGAELIAFVHLVGEKAAGYIFRWVEKPSMFRAYRAIASHPPMVEMAARMIQANDAAVDEETGEAVLWAMKAGGFKRGRPPRVVISTLLAYRERGAQVKDIADWFGFTLDQVFYWMAPPRARAMVPRLRTSVALAVG